MEKTLIFRSMVTFLIISCSSINAYNKLALETLKNKKQVNRDISGGLDFSYADLSNLDLSHVNLSGANLMGVKLDNTNLSGANLSSAIGNLEGSNTNFSHANLSNFNGSLKVINANFNSANLTGAVFKGISASNCNFDNAILYKTQFHFTNLIGSSFKNSDCGFIDLFSTDIRGVNFQGANLTSANFSTVRKSPDYRFSLYLDDWNSVNFSGADLAGSVFCNGSIYKAHLIKQGASGMEQLHGARS